MGEVVEAGGFGVGVGPAAGAGVAPTRTADERIAVGIQCVAEDTTDCAGGPALVTLARFPPCLFILRLPGLYHA